MGYAALIRSTGGSRKLHARWESLGLGNICIFSQAWSDLGDEAW